MIRVCWFDGSNGSGGFWTNKTMADLNLSQITYLLVVGSEANGPTDPSIYEYSTITLHIATIVAACHAVGTKVLLCFQDATCLHTLLANASNRATLATNLTANISTHNADGVYIDWEPAGGLQAGDKANFDLFLADLKTKLGTGVIGITQPYNVADAEFSITSCQYLEFIDFETYYGRQVGDTEYNAERAGVTGWGTTGYDTTKFVLDLSCWVEDSGHGLGTPIATYSDVITEFAPASGVSDISFATVISSFPLQYTADATTDTTHVVDAGLPTHVDDYYVGDRIYNQNRDHESVITAYVDATKTLTISPSITGQTTGDTYYIWHVKNVTSGHLLFQNRDFAMSVVDEIKTKGYKGVYLFEVNNDLLSGNPNSLLRYVYYQDVGWPVPTGRSMPKSLIGSIG